MTLGRGNDVGIGVVLGERPQHLGYKNEDTRTEIGDGNIFREHVTVHRGTTATGVTTIGSNNYFMANSHVGHDCRVGNNVMMVNGTLLAGHCVMEDRAMISGNAAIHQFTRMGRLSLLSGLSSITMDLPPFMMAWSRNVVIGINKIGMRRAGIPVGDIRVAQQAFQILYRSELMQKLAVEKLEQDFGSHPIAAEILTFIRASKTWHHRSARKRRRFFRCCLTGVLHARRGTDVPATIDFRRSASRSTNGDRGLDGDASGRDFARRGRATSAHSVFPVYRTAAAAWIEGADLYTLDFSKPCFRYHPLMAAVFAPANILPEKAAAILWRWPAPHWRCRGWCFGSEISCAETAGPTRLVAAAGAPRSFCKV